MLIMNRKSADYLDIDRYVREKIFSDRETDGGAYPRKIRALHKAIFESASPKQRRYIIMYYMKNMTMEQIADLCGVAKSTVSRTIARGRNNILRAMMADELSALLFSPQTAPAAYSHDLR